MESVENLPISGNHSLPVQASLLPKVVLVGKDDEWLQFVKQLLQNSGCDIQEYYDSDTAVQGITQMKRCVIAILESYHEDWAEVCKNLKVLDSKSGIHVIVLCDEKRDPMELMAMGADDFLIKPFFKNELLARIAVGDQKLRGFREYEQKVLELKSTLHGRYKVGDKIGEGGVSQIFKATDNALAREVAVKKITVQGESSALVNEDMWREARITASLNHPNIVTVYDCWTSPEGCYLVMELLEGTSLEKLIDQEGSIPLLLFDTLVRQTLNGLCAAHAAGVLHCDLKPSNLMLLGSPLKDPKGVSVKILDFGVSQLMKEIRPDYFQGMDYILGSPLFVAPEVFSLESLDQRSDLYSLGHILYMALTGKTAVHGETMDEILDQHLKGEFEALDKQRPDLSFEFCQWVERMMKRDPLRRFSGSREALNEFEALVFQKQQVVDMV